MISMKYVFTALKLEGTPRVVEAHTAMERLLSLYLFNSPENCQRFKRDHLIGFLWLYEFTEAWFSYNLRTVSSPWVSARLIHENQWRAGYFLSIWKLYTVRSHRHLLPSDKLRRRAISNEQRPAVFHCLSWNHPPIHSCCFGRQYK